MKKRTLHHSEMLDILEKFLPIIVIIIYITYYSPPVHVTLNKKYINCLTLSKQLQPHILIEKKYILYRYHKLLKNIYCNHITQDDYKYFVSQIKPTTVIRGPPNGPNTYEGQVTANAD